MNVLEWLLDSDPSIRWQVMRDLTGEPAEAVVAERARVATEGWGAKLLALQDSDGQWGRDVLPPSWAPGELPDVATRKLLRELHSEPLAGMAEFLGVDPDNLAAWEEGRPASDNEGVEKYRGALAWMWNAVGTYSPRWISTTWTLLLLRDMGLDPASEQARRAVALVRKNSKWDEGGQDYFDGEVEPCINGMAVALGAYFGENVDGIVERLLGEQLGDGGWNCEAERGSTRGSFNTTISVLEGLLEYERANGGSSQMTDARRKGEEYLLERRLFRRLSTGEVIDPAWAQCRTPRAGTTTSYGASTIFGALAPSQIREHPRRSALSTESALQTDAGFSRTPIPVGFTSTWTRATASRAVGTPFVPCACSLGLRGVIDDHDRRRRQRLLTRLEWKLRQPI